MAHYYSHRSIVLFLSLLLLLGNLCYANNLPPKNPYLANAQYAMAHGDSAQQDALSVRGPTAPSRTLKPTEIDYIPVGPAHFGANTTSPYQDGRRVLWSNGLDRIVKVDHETFKVIDTYYFPGLERYTEHQADDAINYFNGPSI